MSTLLTAHALHVETAFGPLFNTLSFTLKKGDRIGQRLTRRSVSDGPR